MRSTRPDDDESAIRLARLNQTRAIAEGDLEVAARYWTEDITIRRGLGHSLAGIAAAREMLDWRGAKDAGSRLIYQREAVTVEVSSCWPLAYEEGRWTGHERDVTTKPVVAGRYAAQWVKRDGQWYIRSEVFVALTGSGRGGEASALP